MKIVMYCNLCRTNVSNIDRHRTTQRHRESLRIAKCALDVLHPTYPVMVCTICNMSTGDLIQHFDIAHEDVMFKKPLYSDLPDLQSMFDNKPSVQ